MPLMWFAWMDELEAARARHAFEDAWYRDRGEEGWRAERLGHLALAELNAGNWEAAERMIEKSCATLEQMGLRIGPWGIIWRIRAAVDLHRGRIERARETLLALAENCERTGHHFFAAVAFSSLGSVELAAGDAEAADQAFIRFREHLDTIGVVAAPGPRQDADHVEALVALGKLERADAVLGDLDGAAARSRDRGSQWRSPVRERLCSRREETRPGRSWSSRISTQRPRPACLTSTAARSW